MTQAKENVVIFSLLGVGAIVLLWWMAKNRNAAAPVDSSAVPDNASAAPSYPNSQPIQMGNIEIGGSPLSLTYNYISPQPATISQSATGGAAPACTCQSEGCGTAGMVVNQRVISGDAIKRAAAQLSSFHAQIGSAHFRLMMPVSNTLEGVATL